MLILFLIAACVGYLILSIVSGIRKPDDDISVSVRIAGYILAGMGPVIIAGVMAYLFLGVGVHPTAQFNAGSSPHMDAWSIWVNTWGGLLKLSFVNGFGALIWIVVCIVNIVKKKRHSIAVSICSFLLSVLAFFTVGVYFPTA